jgi:putative NADPH-quinone reductase
MNVLIIKGHLRKENFSEALKNAYVEGAIAGGVVIKKLKGAAICAKCFT